jgi:hypothetical protein
MSLSKSKCWYLNKCLDFTKHSVPLYWSFPFSKDSLIKDDSHRYRKAKIDCLRFVMCPLLGQLEIGFFSSFSAAAVYSTNEANKASLKQSIIFRCLWWQLVCCWGWKKYLDVLFWLISFSIWCRLLFAVCRVWPHDAESRHLAEGKRRRLGIGNKNLSKWRLDICPNRFLFENHLALCS